MKMLLFMFALGAQAGTVYFVSPNGSDSNPGNFGTPFFSLEKARNIIGTGSTNGATVYLRGGLYYRTNTFFLGSTNSGGTTSVVWQAYNGESPIITGGKAITGWSVAIAPAITNRLPVGARGNVLVANLTANGITVNANNGLAFEELVSENQIMQLARYPNLGTFATTAAPGGAYKLVYSGTNPDGWAEPTKAFVWGFWTLPYDGGYGAITSIDSGTKTISFNSNYFNGTEPSSGTVAGARWFALNILEELDQPGEYYIDRTAKLIYFWPTTVNGTNTARLTQLSTPIVSIQSASNIVFSGIAFDGSGTECVTMTNCQSVSLNQCALRNNGGDGLMQANCTYSGISNGVVTGQGLSGVNLDGGDRTNLVAGSNYVFSTVIAGQGRLVLVNKAAVSLNGAGNLAQHNVMTNGPHMAVLLHGNNHIMEYNEIADEIKAVADDAGAVYIANSWCQRGNIYRFNYIHSLTAGTNFQQISAIYLDDFTSGIIIYGNVLWHTGLGIELGGGRANQITNNIFVDDVYGLQIDQRGGTNGFQYPRITNVNDSLYLELTQYNVTMPPYSVQYPELATLRTNDPGLCKSNFFACNISYGPSNWSAALFFPGSQVSTNTPYLTFTNNFFSNQDPLFVDYAHQNFLLQSNSPCLALCFQQIPIGSIGLVNAAPPAPKALRLIQAQTLRSGNLNQR